MKQLRVVCWGLMAVMLLQTVSAEPVAKKIIRAPDMAGYNEMYLMIDMRGSKYSDVSWVDNVHVYKVK